MAFLFPQKRWSPRRCLRRLVSIFVILGLYHICMYHPKTDMGYTRTEIRGIGAQQKVADIGLLTESPHNTGGNLVHTTAPTSQAGNLGRSNESTTVAINYRNIFMTGKWESSFVSRYHKHYDVNCSAIIHGNGAALFKAKRKLRQNKPKIVHDYAVKQWTANCSHYRNTRHYPEKPRSVEEADFPLAYIILTHEGSSQVERLLRAIYQPQNVYCIHPDAKSPPPFWSAIRSLAGCFHNVFVVTKSVNVRYAHSSRLQADVNCMSDLLQRAEPWKYVLNLCAQDFPLKTNLELVRQLKALQGFNDIPGITAPDWFHKRTHIHHEFRDNMMVKRKDVVKPPPPREFHFFWGNAYLAATRGFVEYVIHSKTAIDLLRFSWDTYSPDEHYWVTLHRIPGVPGGYPVSSWESLVRFILWEGDTNHPKCDGEYVRNVCVFGLAYVQYLAKQRHMFANKFHMPTDPIALQCLEELLDYRSVYPESVKDFVPSFPELHMFGL